VAERPMFPEARPSGIRRAVQARSERNAWATLWLAGFAAVLVFAALYVALG
jgi:hypothetical protein